MKHKITLLSALLCGTLSYAQTEFLNTEFGSNGSSCIDVPGQTIIMGDIIKVNNEFYGLTSFTNHALVKFSATGEADPSFGTNGYVQLNLTSAAGSLYDSTNAFIKATPDNNLLMVANTGFLPEHNFMVKTDLNGAPVTSFGANGYVNLAWTDYLNILFTEVINNEIVLVYTNESYMGTEPYRYLMVMKYDLNGNPITTFGTNGYIQLDVDAQSMPQSVYYFAASGQLAVLSDHYSEETFYSSVTKYNLAAGTVDTTFGTNGVINYYPENNVITKPQVLWSDNNSLYLTGYTGVQGETQSVFIKKLGLNGQPDTAFGNNGTFLHEIAQATSHNVFSIIKTDGYLTVTGAVPLANPLSDTIFLVRATENGDLDTSFGNNGFILNPLYLSAYMGTYRTLIEGNHITIATGSNACTTDSQPKPAVIQFIADSALATAQVDKPTLEFYPNPVKDILTIKGDAISTAQVYDISGKLLYTVANPEANRVNLATLQSGLYLINIVTPKGTANIKVVKE